MPAELETVEYVVVYTALPYSPELDDYNRYFTTPEDAAERCVQYLRDGSYKAEIGRREILRAEYERKTAP